MNKTKLSVCFFYFAIFFGLFSKADLCIFAFVSAWMAHHVEQQYDRALEELRRR